MVTYVAIKSKDVLLGRSKLAFEHNTHFHLLIAEHSKAYLSLSRADKTHLVQNLTNDIQAKGGRFLRRCKSTHEWFVVSYREAKEKVGHALRDSSSNKTKCFGEILERSLSLPTIDAPAPDLPSGGPLAEKSPKRRRSATAKLKGTAKHPHDKQGTAGARPKSKTEAASKALADLDSKPTAKPRPTVKHDPPSNKVKSPNPTLETSMSFASIDTELEKISRRAAQPPSPKTPRRRKSADAKHRSATKHPNSKQDKTPTKLKSKPRRESEKSRKTPPKPKYKTLPSPDPVKLPNWILDDQDEDDEEVDDVELTFALTTLSSGVSIVSDSPEEHDPVAATPPREEMQTSESLPTAANCARMLNVLFDEADATEDEDEDEDEDDFDFFSDIHENDDSLEDTLNEVLEEDFLDELDDDFFVDEHFRKLQPCDLHINRSTIPLNRFNGNNYKADAAPTA